MSIGGQFLAPTTMMGVNQGFNQFNTGINQFSSNFNQVNNNNMSVFNNYNQLGGNYSQYNSQINNYFGASPMVMQQPLMVQQPMLLQQPVAPQCFSPTAGVNINNAGTIGNINIGDAQGQLPICQPQFPAQGQNPMMAILSMLMMLLGFGQQQIDDGTQITQDTVEINPDTATTDGTQITTDQLAVTPK